MLGRHCTLAIKAILFTVLIPAETAFRFQGSPVRRTGGAFSISAAGFEDN